MLVSMRVSSFGLGDWAFHCHMLMHMHSGMFRVVTVRHEDGGEGHGDHQAEPESSDEHGGHH